MIKIVDVLIVLSGEGEDHSRTKKAYSIFSYLKKKKKPPYLILTGFCSGLSKLKPKKAESEVMRDYLIKKGVPKSFILVEKKSLDTLGNIIFSRKLLNQLLFKKSSKRVGLVTDDFHIWRSNWIAKRVLGDTYEIIPFPTGKKGSTFFGNMFEYIMKNILSMELWFYGVPAGNQGEFEKLIRKRYEKHFRRGFRIPMCLLNKRAFSRWNKSLDIFKRPR